LERVGEAVRDVIRKYSGLTIIETMDNKLRLEKRNPEALAYIAFAWAMTGGMVQANNSSLLSAAHTLIFLYLAAAAVLNKTIIEVGNSLLTRKVAPLPVPWPRNLVYHYHEISSVICVHSTSKKNPDNTFHRIEILLTNRERKTLVAQVNEKNTAEMVAKRIGEKAGKFKWSYEEYNGKMQTGV
jgi:hypothetical protein